MTPTDDAYVRDGTSYQTSNYGCEAYMYSKIDPTVGYNRQAHLKFNTGAVNGTVTAAKVRIYGLIDIENASDTAIKLMPISDTSWSEGSITWSNKPAAGDTPLATVTPTSISGTYFEFDVTNYLKTERVANRSVVSFRVERSSNSNSGYRWNSKEATTNKPEMVVTAEG